MWDVDHEPFFRGSLNQCFEELPHIASLNYPDDVYVVDNEGFEVNERGERC